MGGADVARLFYQSGFLDVADEPTATGFSAAQRELTYQLRFRIPVRGLPKGDGSLSAALLQLVPHRITPSHLQSLYNLQGRVGNDIYSILILFLSLQPC